jgi:transposase
VRGVIESMTGARFVRDTLEELGWEVLVADAQKVKELAPLACKTDRIDAQVLAVLSHRDLVPAIWLPDLRCAPSVSRHASGCTWSSTARCQAPHPRDADHLRAPVPGFGSVRRRRPRAAGPPRDPRAVARHRRGEPVADRRPRRRDRPRNRQLRLSGAEHPYIPLLLTVPGIGWVLAFTIAGEIGDIHRFATPKKLCGYTGLCPRVNQSGDKDRRGPLTKQGPRYLRWAMLEATMHALRHPAYADRYQATKRRLGKQRGAKVAQIDIARRLTEAVWHMLTRNQPFAPAGAALRLAA